MHVHGRPLHVVANAYRARAGLDQITRMGKGVLHNVFGRAEQQVVVEADLLAMGSSGQRPSVWRVLLDAPEGCYAWCLRVFNSFFLRNMIYDRDMHME